MTIADRIPLKFPWQTSGSGHALAPLSKISVQIKFNKTTSAPGGRLYVLVSNHPVNAGFSRAKTETNTDLFFEIGNAENEGNAGQDWIRLYDVANYVKFEWVPNAGWVDPTPTMDPVEAGWLSLYLAVAQ